MLEQFLMWWTEQLRALLPARLRASRAGQRDAVILALAPGLTAIDLTLRRRGREGALGRFPLAIPSPSSPPADNPALRAAIGPRPPPIELRLPPGLMLDQTTTLPLAAERDPARVLRYEMDRITPFQAHDLHWAHRIIRRDRARSLLHVAIALTPRATIAPILQALEATGLHAAALTAPDGTRIPLDAPAAQGWRQKASTALAIACLLLAIAAAAAPFIRQSRDLAAIDRQIAALRPAVDQAESLRRRTASLAAGIDVLAAQRARSGVMIELLAILTEALPDDTALTDLAVRDRIVSLSGQSAAAARLLSSLAADPALRNTTFTAPVTRNDTTKSEGFTIRTEFAQ